VFCGGGDGGTPPELCSAAGEVAGEGVLELQGSFWAGVWPWMTSVERVTHLSPERGTGVRGAGLTAAAAALGAGNSPGCGVSATGGA